MLWLRPALLPLHLALLCGLGLATLTIRRGQKGLGWAGIACFVSAALIITFWDPLCSLYRYRWIPMNENLLQILYFGLMILGGSCTAIGLLLTFRRSSAGA
ncbi:MAG: hypothetical protein ACM3XM_01995 [Mycobacterium leprae]